MSIKEEKEEQARRGDLEAKGISKRAVFDEEGDLFLDLY